MTHLALVPVPPVAHLDGVSQHYGKTVALNNITLDIPARCMVGLIGPDGVGKSSLLNQLTGNELAIVTPVAGTTRDLVRGALQIEGIPLHVGGRFALGLQGHEHYLRLGDAGTITLYGPQSPPGWVGKLPLEQRFEYQGKGPFDLPAVAFTVGALERTLSEAGLAWHSAAPGADALVCSTPERAMLEFCDSVSDAAGVYEADALMQAMTTLRPQRVGVLLRHCRSVKAKRLFLALAERHRHAWLEHVPLEDVDLGRGKRALVPGGRLHPTYQITLPGDLDEHLA